MPWLERRRRRQQAEDWRREKQRRQAAGGQHPRDPADAGDEGDPTAAQLDELPPPETPGDTDRPPPPALRADEHPPAPAAAVDRPDVPVRLGRVDDDDHARAVRRVVSRALVEDLGHGTDLTSMATVPVQATGRAVLVARQDGVVAGTAVVTEVVRQVDDRIDVEMLVDEGGHVAAGDVVARLEGPLRTLLTAERTLLNLVCQLSGVATLTAAFTAEIDGYDCVVRDTRKTTPGMRLLEKRAVEAGGGANHRIGLHDALLVKDNHVAAAGGVAAAARAALDGAPEGVHVQVEVTSLAEAEEAIDAGVVDLLLDNFTPDELRAAVIAIGGRAAVEASGGITLGTARAFAAAGADRLAVGALTHSAPALDLALDVEQVDGAASPDLAARSADGAPVGVDTVATTGDVPTVADDPVATNGGSAGPTPATVGGDEPDAAAGDGDRPSWLPWDQSDDATDEDVEPLPLPWERSDDAADEDVEPLPSERAGTDADRPATTEVVDEDVERAPFDPGPAGAPVPAARPVNRPPRRGGAVPPRDRPDDSDEGGSPPPDGGWG